MFVKFHVMSRSFTHFTYMPKLKKPYCQLFLETINIYSNLYIKTQKYNWNINSVDPI